MQTNNNAICSNVLIRNKQKQKYAHPNNHNAERHQNQRHKTTTFSLIKKEKKRNDNK